MLQGLRILIVEDEPLIALDLETAIVDHQGAVVGPVDTIVGALQLIDAQDIQGAIIDLRLKNALAAPVAERLVARGIPFIIHSGQADSTLTRVWTTARVIPKPAPPEVVISALAAAIRDRL